MQDGFDLYEFPQGHSGRRTYVSVRGHSKGIPLPYTYKGSDGYNYIRPEFGGDWSGFKDFSFAVEAPMFVRDIGEYCSPIDGSMITSRSAHREHVRRHDVIELGNERMSAPRPDIAPASNRETRERLRNYYDEVVKMPQRDYDEKVAKLAYEQKSHEITTQDVPLVGTE